MTHTREEPFRFILKHLGAPFSIEKVTPFKRKLIWKEKHPYQIIAMEIR